MIADTVRRSQIIVQRLYIVVGCYSMLNAARANVDVIGRDVCLLGVDCVPRLINHRTYGGTRYCCSSDTLAAGYTVQTVQSVRSSSTHTELALLCSYGPHNVFLRA